MMVIFMIVAVLVAMIATSLLKRRNRQLTALAKVQDEFSETVLSLIDDEAVPDAVAEFLGKLHQDVNRGSFLRFFFFNALTGKWKKEAESDFPKNMLALVDKMPAEQKNSFYKATFLFLVATSYRNLILGEIARAAFVLALVKEANNSRSTAVMTYERKGNIHRQAA